MITKLFASALALVLALAPMAQALPSFEFRKPSNNVSQGSIDDTTGELDITAGYKENGSNTLTNSINGNAATATALSANGTNCGAGNYPLGVDASGNAESCTAAASGSGHTLNTSSGTAGAPLSPFSQRTNMAFDSTGFELIDDSSLNSTLIRSKGYQYLVSSFTAIPDSTFTNTVLGPCIAGSTITLTTGNNDVDVSFSGTVLNNTSDADTMLSFLVDGAFPSTLVGGKAAIGTSIFSSNSPATNGGFRRRVKNLSAGSHTFCLTGSVDNGTGRVLSGTIPTAVGSPASIVAEFGVQEIGTGGSGFAAPASTGVFLGGVAHSQSNATFAGCNFSGSTITMTTGGGPVLVSFAGTMSNTGGAGSLGHLFLEVDGALVGGQTATSGITAQVNPGASYSQDMSFSFRTLPLSAGSHSFCLGTMTAFNSALMGSSDRSNGNFQATEIRNAPGTGDVSSSGNNTFSGSHIVGASGTNQNAGWTDWTPSVTGSGAMTATGETNYYSRYQILGKTMCVGTYVTGITLGGTASTSVFFDIPAGKVAAGTGIISTRCGVPGTASIPCFMIVDNGTASFVFQKADATNWALAANQSFAGSMCFEIQ